MIIINNQLGLRGSSTLKSCFFERRGVKAALNHCFISAGPMVRIRLPPAVSQLRTSFSGGNVERSAETTRDDPDGEYLQRNRWFESGSLQRGVRCEPDFRGRSRSMTVGDFA